MITPNIGIVNAMMRIACGLTMLSWATIKYAKSPRKESFLLIMFLAALKVAGGILQFCPLTFLYENKCCYIEDDYEDEALYEHDTEGYS